MDNATQKYYVEHAQTYFEKTKQLDMKKFQEQFHQLLPHSAHILDIGCGSGRDLKYFKEQGHTAIGIEISKPLAQLAQEHSQCFIHIQDFQNIPYPDKTFHGIWVCASLLHATKEEFNNTWQEILRVTKPGAVIFLALKQGEKQTRDQNGRLYYYYDPKNITKFCQQNNLYAFFQQTTSADNTKWINTYIYKPNTTTITLNQAKNWGKIALHHIENAEDEIRWYIQETWDIDLHTYLLSTNKTCTQEQEKKFWNFLQQRSQYCPLAYIIGTQSFMDFTFQVNPSVLIPRPETALIVEYIQQYHSHIKTLLEIGTGSGCIIISLLKYLPQLQATGIEISLEALETTYQNAQNLQVQARLLLLRGDIFSPLFPQPYFDIIVSNPPYISLEEYDTLMPDVKNYEPSIALLGGSDGLQFYKKIISQSHLYLKQNGLLILEMGYQQSDLIQQLAHKHHLKILQIIQDYANIPRIIILQK
jgi:release factor glutamine methyltransferase